MGSLHDNLIFIKMAWLYVMLVSTSMFIGTLFLSLFRYESKGLDWLVILLFIFSAIFLGTSVMAFFKASKLGKEEDRLRELYRR